MQRSGLGVVPIVGLLAVIWILPIIGLVVTSLRPLSETANGWWSLDEVTFTLDAWREVWTKYPLLQGLWTTVKLTVLSTVLTMFLAPAAAYAFHFLRFPGRRWLLVVLVNAFVLPQQIIIIPLFQLWRDLGMIDNIWAVILPQVGLSFSWAVFLVKTFFDDFPKELIEASKIDNCGPIQTFWHVVLPNSVTPITAVGILQFLWCWNSLLIPMLYLRSEAPLTVMLARIAGNYDPNTDLQAVAAIVTMSVPLIVFITFQKYFSAGSGTSAGSKE